MSATPPVIMDRAIVRERWKGDIDRLDLSTGIQGWVIDQASPESALTVELCIDGEVAATARTGIPRGVGQPPADHESRGRFAISGVALRLAIAQKRSVPNAVLKLRVRGHDYEFQSGNELTTVGNLLTLMESRTDAEKQADRLVPLLERLEKEANELTIDTSGRARPSVEGFIESITIGAQGHVWFTGWLNAGHLTTFSGVVAAGQVITPAAIAIFYHGKRPDLPEHGCMVTGIIASKWRPDSLDGEFSILFGRDLQYRLRSFTKVYGISTKQFLEKFTSIATEYRTGNFGALARVLSDAEEWLPSRSAIQGFVIHGSVDRILLIPGFGYFIDGWLLSPGSRVVGMQLRIEGQAFNCAMDTVFRKHRPDLLTAFPTYAALCYVAGFTACFPGNPKGGDIANPMLRLTLENGKTWIFAIAHDAIREMGRSAALVDIRAFYAAVENEVFFVRLAKALREAPPPATVIPHTVTRADAVAILMLPGDRCDLICLFDEMSSRISENSFAFGIVFVAPSNSFASDVTRLFSGISSKSTCKASLFFADADAQPFDLLLPIFERTGARRFVFVGPAVFLNDLGWAQAGRALQPIDDDLWFFQITQSNSQAADSVDVPAALCFAWSSDAFATWQENSPRIVGGFFRDNGLRAAQQKPVTVGNAARLTRRPQPSTLEDAVNALVVDDAVH